MEPVQVFKNDHGFPHFRIYQSFMSNIMLFPQGMRHTEEAVEKF